MNNVKRLHSALSKALPQPIVDWLRRLKKNEITDSYQAWIKNHEHKLWVKTITEQSLKISVVVPAFNTPDKYIEPLINSFFAQTYDNWELCLVDASDDSERSEKIKQLASNDSRIVYIRHEENEGIAANTNIGIQRASGDYIGFVDHDDTLSPHALNEVVSYLLENPDTEIVYSDEDKLSDDGNVRSLPFFKPDWSPQLLESVNYMAHFVVVKSELMEQLGGIRESDYDGAQDYDFVLRASEAVEKVHHIPKILYHWRMADGSTAKAVGEKNYADDAGKKALKDFVKRNHVNATVTGVKNKPTNYRLKYDLSSKTMISIIIPFKDKVDYLRSNVTSILNKTNINIDYEILLISNNSTDPETVEYLAKVQKEPRVQIYEWNHKFNFSAINNFGRSKAKGDCLVFLNNDTEVISPDWLRELSSVAMQSNTGAVGPLLLYPDNRIQHAGVVLGMNTMAGHVFRFRSEHELTPFGLPSWPRNYLAVTGACLAVQAEKFDKAGGFDEDMIVAGSDVSLCISLYELGLNNVYWPFVKLFHHESVSVKTYDNGLVGDFEKSLTYYRPYLNHNDPYFNPNLDLMDEHISFRKEY